MKRASNWEALFRIACHLIDQVNSEFQLIEKWTFGGGTALMLQIGHRDSFDVAIFIDDPQLLGFLDPAKSSLTFNIQPDSTEGDGAIFRRFVFREIGEIDFIVGAQLTNPGSSKQKVAGRQVALETVAEIVAKKVHYRGRSIRPRDIFDIAAAAKDHAEEMRAALLPFLSDVDSTLHRLRGLSPLFVESAIAKLNMRPEFSDLAEGALATAMAFLDDVSRSPPLT